MRPLAILTFALVTAGCYRVGPVFGRDGGAHDAGTAADASADAAIPSSTCGNGIVERAANPPEYCDDGNMNDNDLCRNDCTRGCTPPATPSCNENDDDCTSGTCDMLADMCFVVREPVGTPCTSGAGCAGGVCTLPPYEPPSGRCGNGIVERTVDPPEFCDDGNTNDADLCRNTCTRGCAPPGTPVCEENADDCTSGMCDMSADECVVVRAPVGTPCVSGAGCVGGVCTLPP